MPSGESLVRFFNFMQTKIHSTLNCKVLFPWWIWNLEFWRCQKNILAPGIFKSISDFGEENKGPTYSCPIDRLSLESIHITLKNMNRKNAGMTCLLYLLILKITWISLKNSEKFLGIKHLCMQFLFFTIFYFLKFLVTYVTI